MKPYYVMILISVLFFSACSEQSAYKDKVNYKERIGSLSGTTYTNTYFGFTIQKPEAWLAQDDETRQKIMKIGAKVIAGDDKNLESLLNSSKIRNLSLFSFSKFKLGIPNNPNIMGIAEDISFVPAIKTSVDYIQNMKRVLSMAQIKYNIDEKIGSQNIGGVDFDVLTTNVKVANTDISQKYFVSLSKGYALLFVITHTDQSSHDSLMNILQTIKFNK